MPSKKRLLFSKYAAPDNPYMRYAGQYIEVSQMLEYQFIQAKRRGCGTAATASGAAVLGKIGRAA